MSAHDERRAQDVSKLKELQKLSRDRVRVVRVAGTPVNLIEGELHLRTAASTSYPNTVQEVTHFSVSLPARYPFVEPTVNITSPILHPNIWTSGRVCLGIKWIPSFGLDLLVRRLAQIITFDPEVLNLNSPANGTAVSWYMDAVRRHPARFPSDRLDLTAPERPKTMSWTNADTPPAKVAVACPNCSTKMALPAGRAGNVVCPGCGKTFAART